MWGATSESVPARVLSPLDDSLIEFKYLPQQIENLEKKVRLRPAVIQAMKGALAKSDIEIKAFNSEFKNEYGFPSELGGLAVYSTVELKMTTPFDFFLNPFDLKIRLALDQVMQKNFDSWFKKDYTLFLPDEPIRGSLYNPLLVTIHELAHVDFHRRVIKLRKNARIPIRKDLFTYLNERYAHEIEFILLKSIQRDPELFFRTPRKWIERAHLGEGALVRRSIARYVREVYGLRDPDLARFDGVPLDDLINLLKD
ncbi:MAG: hypothetical protein ACK5V3_05310 [Bdellovibrionales bacterium]